jgi:hypothetical protein
MRMRTFLSHFPYTKALSLFGLLLIIILLLAISYSQRLHEIHQPTAGGPSAAESRKMYYVSPAGSDANDGLQLHPFATIQKAARVASPGTTIRVLPGIYTTRLDTKTSGTAEARITYISYIKWRAKIKTTGVPTSWFNEGNYVDIIGFDITGDGSEGIYNRGSFTRIIGNHIHNIPASACSSLGGGGIVDGNYAGSDDDLIGNVVHDIGPLTNCNAVHGIYQANLGGHIWNNISYRNAAWGIHLWHAANAVTIANNLVFENGKGGITVGAGDAPGGVIDDNTIVTNNIIMHNFGPAIYEYGQTGRHNRYLNNLIFANSRGILLQNSNRDQGTLIADPQLVNYQLDDNSDYHLKASSPAIDAGTSTGAPLYDIDGISRPQGKGFDIGPYEYRPAYSVLIYPILILILLCWLLLYCLLTACGSSQGKECLDDRGRR